jgi:hypothetical protein
VLIDSRVIVGHIAGLGSDRRGSRRSLWGELFPSRFDRCLLDRFWLRLDSGLALDLLLVALVVVRHYRCC